MEIHFVRKGLVAGALGAALIGCGDLPTFVDEERQIAAIRVTGCGAVGEGATCQVSAEAFDENGNTIPEPRVFWSSSNPTVATVTSNGTTTATVRGNSDGTAVVSARDSSGRISGDITIRVSPATGGGGGPGGPAL